MGVELTALHGIYVSFILLIIGFMIMRRDTSLTAAFFLLRRDMKRGNLAIETNEQMTVNQFADSHDKQSRLLSKTAKKSLAFIVPLLFAIDVAAMYYLNLQGGDATALVGGTSIFILIIIALLAHKHKGLEETTNYLIEGFQFGYEPPPPTRTLFRGGSFLPTPSKKLQRRRRLSSPTR
ncbi:hypothetical protein [Bacillus alveayuensis]|uniref:hypothetical protein n=1 Tax=Aeribacillus alveayuensis TaxID=279215 RepID=UPI0005CD24C8|nr:hypothetical protein [Bacillus alveayuensis]